MLTFPSHPPSRLTYAAVDEWIMRFGALQQLDAEQPWFRSMMHQIAMKLLGDAAWGLKARLFFGAALSMVDMASDLNMVVLYWSNDQFRDAYLLLGCILGSILLQLFVVWLQNGAKPTHLLRDVFFVVTGLKAGVDAVKVASGNEMEEHHLFSAHLELIANKCIELIFEAIPVRLRAKRRCGLPRSASEGRERKRKRVRGRASARGGASARERASARGGAS